MRQNASADHATKPLRHAPCYYSPAEALEINERARGLCSTAARISHRAELLVEASCELERLTKELRSGAKAARIKRHESVRSG